MLPMSSKMVPADLTWFGPLVLKNETQMYITYDANTEEKKTSIFLAAFLCIESESCCDTR